MFSPVLEDLIDVQFFFNFLFTFDFRGLSNTICQLPPSEQ